MKIFVGAGDRKAMDPEKLRVPVPETLEIIIEDFVGFIKKYASNISKGGVFVATEKPIKQGTSLEINFRLEDDYTLIRARGTVAWVRHEGLGPQRPAGMGIRFDWLDDESEVLIDKIVSNYIKEGGRPFRLDQEAPTASEGAPPPQTPDPSPLEAPPESPPAQPVQSVPPAAPPAQLPSEEEPAARSPETLEDVEPEAPQLPDASDPDPRVHGLSGLQASADFAPGLGGVEQGQSDRAEFPGDLASALDPAAAGATAPPPAAASAGEGAEPPRDAPPAPGLEDLSIDLDSAFGESEGTPDVSGFELSSLDESPADAPSSEEEELGFSIEFDRTDVNELTTVPPTAGDDAPEEEEELSYDLDPEPEQQAELEAPSLELPSLGEESAIELEMPGFPEPSAPEDTPPERLERPASLSVEEPRATDSSAPSEPIEPPPLFEPPPPEPSPLEAPAPAPTRAPLPVEPAPIIETRASAARGRRLFGRRQSGKTPKRGKKSRSGVGVRGVMDATLYVLRVMVSVVVFLAMGAGLYLLGQQAVEEIGERRVEGSVPNPVNLSDTPEILENQAPTILNLQREGKGPSVTAREEGRPVSSVTEVHNITWSETENETVVTVWGNGAFTPTNTGYTHLDGDSPREVVRILGVEGPYSPSSLDIETPHVERLRIGFHPGRHFHELHVVADLVSPEVTLASFEFDRSNLVLRFTRGS